MVTVLPLVSGVLQELPVDVGQAVRKGQVVARIDAQRYELQLQQAEAAYRSSKSSYERIGQLYRASAASQQSYEQAKGQYDAYQSQYELARIQLDYATVKSPVDGVILVKHISAGSIAAPERPLVTIGDLTDLVVRAKVPERYYEDFIVRRDTMPIRIKRSGSDQFNGKIRSVSPFVSAETKNFEVVVAIGDIAGSLRPGMFVSLEFELARWPDAYSVPFEALSGGRLWWVEDGKARSEPFNPFDASATAFAVPAEWADRDIIIEGQYFTREGSPVTVVSPLGTPVSAGK
jgi:RND family efflux transporter MFP subunit